ncbi:MAG TPA: class I SAM-dependent methyltransferase [Solirubrobacteraceae bacterium]|nr:class I SAM-dependent methyltransferase [Solirubrobacteraceae bacterium]
MAPIPQSLRSLAPERLRDDVRLRALGVGLGLIPPRTMHSAEDASVLLAAARGARRVVEIGVYEGASALTLLDALGAGAELHLIDPFGRRPDALPSGWGATEWATRRVLARAQRRRGDRGPSVRWHAALSHEVAASWSQPVDLVFVDGDHSEAGCELDWDCWRPFVAVGGRLVLHDARADRPGGRGLPGPTAVVARRIRAAADPRWEILAEADRTVAVRRLA